MTATVLRRSRVAAALAQFDRRAASGAGRQAAAVAIALTTTADGETAFVLTRRSGKLRTHAGQFALPGGRIEHGEDAAGAALRELAEEVGVVLGPESVLGLLDDYLTRSGFCITPVVVWAGRISVQSAADDAEVTAVYVVPVSALDVEPTFEPISGSAKQAMKLTLGTHRVFAPTGAVLYQFREVVMCGRPTRVDEFEQPRFAWR